MANPRVRQHLHFLPERNVDGHVSQAWQASRWLDELDPQLLTQMIRLNDDRQQDYYVYEPALLMDGRACIPTRWYVKAGVRHAKAWLMVPDVSNTIWLAREYEEIDVSEDQLMLPLPGFHASHEDFRLPDPHNIKCL